MNYAPSPRQDHIANTLICDKYPRFVSSHQEKILSGTINKLKVASTMAKVKYQFQYTHIQDLNQYLSNHQLRDMIK